MQGTPTGPPSSAIYESIKSDFMKMVHPIMASAPPQKSLAGKIGRRRNFLGLFSHEFLFSTFSLPLEIALDTKDLQKAEIRYSLGLDSIPIDASRQKDFSFRMHRTGLEKVVWVHLCLHYNALLWYCAFFVDFLFNSRWMLVVEKKM